jgi:peroxiredoxin Q/BCP
MKALGRDLPRFNALDAQVLGVSYDDPDTQRDFARHCAAAFPFLADPGGRVARKYGADGGFGPIQFANRVTILIDTEGVVRQIYTGMPDDERILADLSSPDRLPTLTPPASPSVKGGQGA